MYLITGPVLCLHLHLYILIYCEVLVLSHKILIPSVLFVFVCLYFSIYLSVYFCFH